MQRPPIIKIIEQTEVSCLLKLNTPAELEAFKGHFDEAPIIPGVIQVGWAIDFTQEYLLPHYHNSQLERIDALKFQQVIQPNTELLLSLSLKNNKVVFSFQSENKTHSSGKLIIAL